MAFTPGSYSQPLRFQSYTTSQGLSQNSVYSICQTADRLMWFGTQDGLNRFDGQRFENIFTTAGIDSNTVYSKFINALAVDPNDMIWIGTTEGLVLYDRFTNKILNLHRKYKAFAGVGNANIHQFLMDDQNQLWILSREGRLWSYSFDTHTGKEYKPFDHDSYITKDIQGKVYVSSDKNIYVCTGSTFKNLNLNTKYSNTIHSIPCIQGVHDDLWAIVNGNDLIRIKTDKNNEIIQIKYIKQEFPGMIWPKDMRLIHASDRNTVWIGSRSRGLLKLNEDAKTCSYSSELNKISTLQSQFILSIYTDMQGLTWIGESVGGIAKYDNANTLFELYRIEKSPDNLVTDNAIFSIHSPNDVDFYCGTLIGGVLHQNIKTGYYKYLIPDESNEESKNVYKIIQDGNTLWIATWAGLYMYNVSAKSFTYYSNASDVKTLKLYTILKLNQTNTLLAGGENGGIKLFDLKSHIWSDVKYKDSTLKNVEFKVRHSQQIKDEVWLATEKKNLIIYNISAGSLTFLPQYEKIAATARHFLVEQEYLWIATDHGLIQSNKNTHEIKKVWNMTSGLPNDVIYSVINDDNDFIWLSSNNGISKIYPGTGVIENHNENAGLQGKEFNTAACFKDAQGNIWMGGVNGMNKINPIIETPVFRTTKPIIRSIKVMNKEWHADSSAPYIKKVNLPYNQNMLDIEFQSPDFSQTENIDYYSKMDGVDSGWVALGKRNYLSYSQLNPGKYVLHLQAKNINQSRSETTLLHIYIDTPWYKTVWFTLMTLGILGYLIYLLYNFRVNQILQVERMRQRISADLHDDIGASLTSISVLSKMATVTLMDKNMLDKYLMSISDQASHVTDSLRDIVWSIQPQNDKLQQLIDRMKKFAGQILESKNIQYVFDDQQILNKDLSLDIQARQNIYLVFKEILNNLVKHADSTKVNIKLSSQVSNLTIGIQDNGKGFDPTLVTRGNGLSNMKNRTENIHGQFTMYSEIGKGTKIECTFPINHINM